MIAGPLSKETFHMEEESFGKPDILEKYPEYASTALLDELRFREYGYLDEQGHTYLDYTGSGLAARAQLKAHHDRLARTTFGNPHSINPTSLSSTGAIEATRLRVLSFFNASPEEYDVIFTPNATGAARLVGEAYPFTKEKRYIYTADNHNSIVGFREFARRSGSRFKLVPLSGSDLRIDRKAVVKALKGKALRARCKGSKGPRGHRGLFAYPAQSNFSGVQHPLEWVELAQREGYDVLLDVAAYIPTNALDLSKVKPDFLIASWYKVFGYPTGVGCLIARRDALSRLVRPWFSGGTVEMVTISKAWHKMLQGGHGYEDGTVNFLSIPDVHFGLDWVSGIGMDTIKTRVKCLTGHFLDQLRELKHSDGSPMVQLFGPDNTESRGGTVTFQVLDARGQPVDERIIDAESASAGISLRTGCFCNPGAGEVALDFQHPKLPSLISILYKNTMSRTKWTPEELIRARVRQTLRAIRVSFGLASTVGDVDKIVSFVETYRDRTPNADDFPPRGGC
ncbi:Molybdenum cofactor sulfurase [Escovopsis weberi]|uniref:Molybdenum cofactor sulfurase n=1 Tax=Escovopsis weberi TaxID=150374 RepID=A0A0M9VRR2_ESCWE|nr:Molybdenum cofactor sulfurase [Escovopsis weberi]